MDRSNEAGVPLSFCGEDAGRPIEAATLAALGLRRLSMRPASIGPVKHLFRRIDLSELSKLVAAGVEDGAASLRPEITDWLARNG